MLSVKIIFYLLLILISVLNFAYPEDNIKEVTKIEGIRYWSNPDYTRVVIDGNGPFQYSIHQLKRVETLEYPDRIYLDFESVRLSEKLSQPIEIKDGLLRRVRFGVRERDMVRIVLDLEKLSEYKIFLLKNPTRLVIDIFHKKSPDEKQTPLDLKLEKEPADKLKIPERRLTIVIDPGHGGKDPGAIGWMGIKEKDVVLEVGKRLKTKLEKNPQFKVIMTRTTDIFIPLEERTAIANTNKADLFISIHANASHNKEKSGIETYFLNFTSDEEALNVAARENAATRKELNDLQIILNDLILTSKINESSFLAGCVQDSLYKGLSEHYEKVKNLGVKGGPFYVLVNARMPSILIEISFITHKEEGKRLSEDDYLEQISSSIYSGILRYQNDSPYAAVGSLEIDFY